jgi:hypothetical protein
MIGDHIETLRNATGSPRGFLRSSLGKASASNKREAPWDKPVACIVCAARSLATIATIHGASPWHSLNRKSVKTSLKCHAFHLVLAMPRLVRSTRWSTAFRLRNQAEAWTPTTGRGIGSQEALLVPARPSG